MAGKDKIERARHDAELAEQRARKRTAEVKARAADMQMAALKLVDKKGGRGSRRRNGRGGGMGGGRTNDAFLMSSDPDGSGSGGRGGYRSDSWPRNRADSRGRGGSASSFLSDATRRRIRIDCQRLDRRNPLARALNARSADLCVADGFGLQVQSADKKWNTAVEQWFNLWARRTGFEAMDGKGCDVTGQKTLAHFTFEVDRSLHCDGDIGVVFTDQGCLQAVESERIMNPGNRADTDGLVGGVEMDAQGRPRKYHVADWAPTGSFAKPTTYAVSAEHFALLVNPTRARFNQWRGEPSLAAVIERFENLDDTSEAVRMAYFLAACQGLIITSKNPGIEQGLVPGVTVTNDDGNSERHEYIEPGQIRRVAPNSEIFQVDAKHPTTSYDLLRMAEVTDIAADAGMPVVLLLLDFTKVNFSSARSAVVTAYRGLRRRQKYLIDSFLSRVYRWRVAMAIRRGEIPGFAAGYVPEGWDKHEWTAPPPPVLDVLAEVEAAEKAVASRLKSRSRVMQETWGIDFESEMQRIAMEDAEMAAAGIAPTAEAAAARANTEAGEDAEDAEGPEDAETAAPGTQGTSA